MLDTLLNVMRWISLGLSLFALCISSYSLWLSARRNRRLLDEKWELLTENARLRAMCDSYWEEIVELRERLYGSEENQLQTPVETAD